MHFPLLCATCWRRAGEGAAAVPGPAAPRSPGPGALPSPGKPPGTRRAAAHAASPGEGSASPLQPPLPGEQLSQRNNLHGEELFVARLVYSLKKWPFPPHSLKNKVTQRNTNGTAMTRAVTCRSDLIHEISSYRIILLWFPSKLCAGASHPVFR